MTAPRKRRPPFHPTPAKVAILRVVNGGGKVKVPGPARSALRRLKVEGLVRYSKVMKSWGLTARGTSVLGRYVGA